MTHTSRFDLVAVRRVFTLETLAKEWDQAEAILAERLNRTDLAPDARTYLEDLLQEVNRQREIAAHKEPRPVFKETPIHKEPRP